MHPCARGFARGSGHSRVSRPSTPKKAGSGVNAELRGRASPVTNTSPPHRWTRSADRSPGSWPGVQCPVPDGRAEPGHSASGTRVPSNSGVAVLAFAAATRTMTQGMQAKRSRANAASDADWGEPFSLAGRVGPISEPVQMLPRTEGFAPALEKVLGDTSHRWPVERTNAMRCDPTVVSVTFQRHN